MALGGLGTAYSIWASREAALRQWQNRLTAATHMLTAHAIQTLDAADIMLRAAHDNLLNSQFTYEPDFEATVSTYRIHEMLRDAMHGLPQVAGIRILGNDGALLNLSRQYPPPQINFADQDYFRAFAENPALEASLGRVSMNPITHAPHFYLARAIKSPSGERLGLIVADLPSFFFSSFYQEAVLGDLRISLIRRDGSVLSRNFDLLDPLNERSELSPDVFRQFGTADSGIRLIGGSGTSQSFNEMVVFQRNHFLPIGISTALSNTQIFSHWKSLTVKYISIYVIISALLIIFTLLLSRLVSQLEQTRNAALSAADAKTRFVANISHELRTPMNAIIGGTHQLQQANLQPEVQRTLQIVSSSAQQLTVLINDLLDFSYFEAREFRIETAPFDPHVLTQTVMDMARAMAPETKLELTAKVDANTPALIIGDANRIKQILLNLLSNAIKYTERGKVELRVSYLGGQNNLLILRVIDTGTGIPDKDRTRIFEPFERTDRARQKPGTGLGLTICKKLTKAMSGTIRVHSEIGQGTEVCVEIPSAEARQDQAVAAELDTLPIDFKTSLRILVAEDVAPSRILLTLMLEKSGHQVTAVENGLEAVYAASQSSFDLILMDLQMPEMDGLTAARRIRTPGALNQFTSIIAVSAHADVEGPNGLAAAGFNDALLKPVKPERLNFVLSQLTA